MPRAHLPDSMSGSTTLTPLGKVATQCVFAKPGEGITDEARPERRMEEGGILALLGNVRPPIRIWALGFRFRAAIVITPSTGRGMLNMW